MELISLALLSFGVSVILFKIVDLLSSVYNINLCKICVNNAVGLVMILSMLFNIELIGYSIVIWISLLASNSVIEEFMYGDSFIDKFNSFKETIKRIKNGING